MIEITVKTLDSKNHSFSVPDDFTVKQFKEKIAESISISAESQRLIYCGRVLQDEKTLREYDVNGKVIHLVQRPPPVSNGSGPDRGPSNTRSSTGSNARRTPLRLFGPAGNAGNAMYLGAMAFPAEIMDASGMSMQQPRQCLSQSRLNVVRNMLRRASVILNRLENPPQTSADTSPDNGNASPERSTEEEVSAGTPDIEIVSSSSVEIAASVEITPTSFIIDNPQDLGGPSVEVQIDPAAEQNNQTPERESQPATEQQPEQNGSEETGDGARTPSRYPRTAALADLLDQAAEVNTRVQPFMAQYQQLMRDDPTFSDQAAVATNQQLFTSVSEIMHNLAHAYHALSDIMCDFSQPPPRFLRCRPVLIHHSAVVQTGIPIQVATNLAAGTGQQPNASNANARSRGNARGTGTSTTTGPAPATAAAAADESSTQAPQAQPTPTNEESSPAQSSVPAPTSTTASQAPTTDQTPSAGQGPPTTGQAAPTAAGQTPTAAGQNPTTGQTPPRTSRLGGYRLYESPFANATNGSSSVRTSMRQVSGPEFEIFVDVTPGSITIDSLETTVLPNVPINTTEANSWQNPPDFVQNLVSALAGQFMGATLQQYRFPEQQSTGTSTQQTTTAATATTAASATTATAASSTQQSASGQTPSAAQNSQARGNTATHPTTATQTRSTARPHVHLSPSIHGLRTNSFDPFLPCNSHHIRSGRSRQRPNQTNTSNGATATADTPRTTPTSGSNSISISVRADPVINVDQEAQRAAGNQTRSQSIFPADLQFLLSAFRGANSVMNRAPNPSTLSELLENVPGYTYTPGESIFTDIFMILAQSLTFVDLVEMRMGTSDGLLRARPQLQELITQRLLNNRPLTISAITQIVDRINSELQPHFSIFEYTRWREDIDLAASINLYNHSMLPSILNTIMEEDQATFQATLISKCIQYTRQLCTLLQYCCVDGVSGLEAIVQAFVNQTTTDVPRILQDWTMSQSIINFHTFLGTLNVPVEDIKRYLVYRTGNNPATSPQPAATPPAIPPAAEPMDVQEVEETHSEPIPSLIREPSVADVPPTQHINEAIGWQSALPSEWVPIITRDSQRQRRQNSQGPFSDAYLSGMPSKRRKLITSAKPQGNLSQVITESMTTALSAAGMSSGPEVDVVAQRAGQDCSLRTAYREQVRATLQHNLNSHPDYLPEKYPNTTKYFKKK